MMGPNLMFSLHLYKGTWLFPQVIRFVTETWSLMSAVVEQRLPSHGPWSSWSYVITTSSLSCFKGSGFGRTLHLPSTGRLWWKENWSKKLKIDQFLKFKHVNLKSVKSVLIWHFNCFRYLKLLHQNVQVHYQKATMPWYCSTAPKL
jgi:hypothetical protein